MNKTVYVALSQFCEYDDRPRRLLLNAGFQVTENKTGRRMISEEMEGALKEADAVLAGVEPYPAQLLEKLSRLKVISRCGVATDSIDLRAAKKRNIRVMVTADVVAEPVAQMTVGMILALVRNFPHHLNDFQDGLWKKHTGFLLSELTIGLIGFGRIGKQVFEYLKVFGCQLGVFDPFVDSRSVPKELAFWDLDTLLAQSDVISLHLNRSPEEGPILGSRELRKMKKGSYLVNTARGYLIDEFALEEVLRLGHLAGAALDVFGSEPYTGPLAKLPMVLCTPHVATLTRGSRAAMELKCAQSVVDFFPIAYEKDC